MSENTSGREESVYPLQHATTYYDPCIHFPLRCCILLCQLSIDTPISLLCSYAICYNHLMPP